MAYFSIRMEAIPSCPFRELITDAVRLARIHDCMIEFDFNDLPVFITPDSEIEGECRDLSRRIDERAKKATKKQNNKVDWKKYDKWAKKERAKNK